MLALVWFYLRKGKNKKALQQQGDSNYYQGNMYQSAPMEENPKTVYAQTAAPWHHEVDGQPTQYIAEAPGDTHMNQLAQRPPL